MNLLWDAKWDSNGDGKDTLNPYTKRITLRFRRIEMNGNFVALEYIARERQEDIRREFKRYIYDDQVEQVHQGNELARGKKFGRFFSKIVSRGLRAGQKPVSGRVEQINVKVQKQCVPCQ